MQQWITMVAALVPVFGLMAVGLVARRINWLTEEADRTLISLCVRLLFPCFIVYQMNRSEWLTEPAALLLPPIAGFGLTALGFVVCWLFIKPFGSMLGLRTPAQRRTFVLCAGMFNYGYIPIPLIRELFPANSREMPVLLLHNVGVEIAMWTLGMLILAGKLGKRWWVGILNPVVLAIIAAIVLKLTGAWPKLETHAMPLLRIVDQLGQCAIPLSLLLSGATISDVFKEADFREGWGVMGGGIAIRLAILPLMFILLAFALPVGESLKHVMIIQAAMPAAIFPIVLTRHYGGDPPTAVRVVVGTQLLSLLTTPMWLSIGL